MISARSAILAGLAFLATGSQLKAQLPIEDPQALYESTQAALDRGDLERARPTLTAIRLLIEAEPGWDPDGSFSRTLIPQLADRLARLQAASSALEALRHALSEEGDPDLSAGTDGLTRSLNWGTTVARRVKDGTAEIVESLPAGAERGALLQSEILVKTRGVVQDRVLPYMTGELSGHITDLIERDEQIDIMKKRMESLRHEVMRLNIEAEERQEELAAAREGHTAHLRGLIKLIAAHSDPAEPTGEPGALDVESVLARRIRERLLEVRSLEEQTLVRKALLLEELARFRFVNEAVVAEGGRNNTGRIDLLAAAIEKVPLQAGGIDEESMGWMDRLLSTFGQ